jgi:hypothetical protein
LLFRKNDEFGSVPVIMKLECIEKSDFMRISYETAFRFRHLAAIIKPRLNASLGNEVPSSDARAMSALPPITDIHGRNRIVR